MKLKETLDKLAKAMTDKASLKDTPLQESIDAFKALTAYYAVEQRNRKKSGPDEEPDDGEFTFGEAGNGGSAKVHPHRSS